MGDGSGAPEIMADGSEPEEDTTEFERFEDLTRRLVAVSKSELDRAREAAKKA